MELSLLADDPAAASTVAKWYFDEWCKNSGRYTKEEVAEKVSASVNRQQAPLIVLAKNNDVLVGAAELKTQEMDTYPDFEFWLGGVFVSHSARGQGIASALVTKVMSLAKKAGIAKLYLQTEDLTGGLYLKHGFTPIEQSDSRGVQVLVMVADIE